MSESFMEYYFFYAIVFSIIIGIVLGWIPAIIASNKGHDFFTWWVYGFCLFIIALPHSLLIGKDKTGYERKMFRQGYIKCPFCMEMIYRRARICPHCRSKI